MAQRQTIAATSEAATGCWSIPELPNAPRRQDRDLLDCRRIARRGQCIACSTWKQLNKALRVGTALNCFIAGGSPLNRPTKRYCCSIADTNIPDAGRKRLTR